MQQPFLNLVQFTLSKTMSPFSCIYTGTLRPPSYCNSTATVLYAHAPRQTFYRVAYLEILFVYYSHVISIAMHLLYTDIIHSNKIAISKCPNFCTDTSHHGQSSFFSHCANEFNEIQPLEPKEFLIHLWTYYWLNITTHCPHHQYEGENKYIYK